MCAADENLVRQTRGGRREAFALLVERYERPALAKALAILHDRHDASDAVQDAFVRAYERLHRLRTPAKFAAWFLRIVRHQALGHLRRRKIHRRGLAVLHAQPPRAAPAPAVHDSALVLIGRLPEQEIVVVALRHLDERSVAEISAMTGRPVGTVTKQLSRAYARMRVWLREQEEAS